MKVLRHDKREEKIEQQQQQPEMKFIKPKQTNKNLFKHLFCRRMNHNSRVDKLFNKKKDYITCN